MLRILATIIVCVSVVFVPWYIVCLLALSLMVAFKEYYEAFIIILFLAVGSNHYFVPLAICASLLLIVEYIKVQTILYKS